MMLVEGLEYMVAHLRPRQEWQDHWTWRMVWQHQEVMYRPDCLLATNCQTLSNVVVRYPCQNSNHYMVLGCLCSRPLQENNSYLVILWCFPLNPQAACNGSRVDSLFKVLRKVIPFPNPRTFPQKVWISQDTWYIIDQHIYGRRDP